MTKKRGSQLKKILLDILGELQGTTSPRTPPYHQNITQTKNLKEGACGGTTFPANELLVINDNIKIPISDIKINTVGINDEIHCVLLNGLCKNLLKNQEKISAFIGKAY